MEGGNEDNKGCEGKAESKLNYKRGKPPDKRRHHMEMNKYTELIHQKEALFKSLNAQKLRKSTSSVHGSREELLAKLQTLKSDKEGKMKAKQVIDAELKTLNQQVVKKNEACMKLQVNVKYKDEQRTNDSIKHLEKYLSTHQLKLCEEKKVVCEIDALKRSKKVLSEYLSAKQEVDQLRQKQNRLRSERDVLIKETHEIRARENDIKVSLDSLKEESKEMDNENITPSIDKEALKKEIDSLYEKRRDVHDNYKRDLANYYEEQKQNERGMKAEKRREETRLTKITADRGLSRQEKRYEPKPYEDEKNICVCLIQYLEPLISNVQCVGENDEVDGSKTNTKYLEVPKSSGSTSDEGSYTMNPDDNLGGLFVQSNRRMTRKGSRKGRKSKDSAQKLVLHPHVFEQFFKVNLEPPSTYADVSAVLEKLKEKSEFYQKESSKSRKLLVIPENVASTNFNVEHIENKAANLVNPLESESNLRLNEQNERAVETKHELGGVLHEIVKEEPKADQTEHEIGKLQPQHEQVDHEVEQAEHESGEGEDDGNGIQHENKDADHDEKEAKEDEATKTFDEKANFADQLNIFKNERSCCKDEDVTKENLLNKTEGDEDRLKSSCKTCPTIITDALEKNMESIKMKESSKEIQVRVT